MTQRIRERRKIGLAILISLFLHFVVAFSLAAFGDKFTSTPLADEKPVELTIVDLSATPPPTVPINPPYLETAASKESAEKPKEQTFESNANSIAASEQSAMGDAPVPSQKGKDRPFVNLETHDFSLASKGAQPQPERSVAPQPTQKATPTPAAVATPAANQFALLTATPPPIKSPDEAAASPTPEIAPSTPPPAPRPNPALAASAYQPQKQQTRLTGRITNRGPSAVNAVGTPIGRYQKAVSDAIGSRWYYYMSSKMDLVSIGTAHVEAEVDAEGHVQRLRVLSNNGNEAFANICLQSFQEAHLPPIPPDLATTLPGGRMPVDIYFTTFAN